jgi:hypothetical protein
VSQPLVNLSPSPRCAQPPRRRGGRKVCSSSILELGVRAVWHTQSRVTLNYTLTAAGLKEGVSRIPVRAYSCFTGTLLGLSHKLKRRSGVSEDRPKSNSRMGALHARVHRKPRASLESRSTPMEWNWRPFLPLRVACVCVCVCVCAWVLAGPFESAWEV